MDDAHRISFLEASSLCVHLRRQGADAAHESPGMYFIISEAAPSTDVQPVLHARTASYFSFDFFRPAGKMEQRAKPERTGRERLSA
jgi:hypothetical protein